MPIPPGRPPQLIGKVFRGSDVVARGLLTRKQLRSSAWVRLRQDIYADATLELTYRVRISAVGLDMPGGAAFVGRSALLLWGIGWAAGAADPVEVGLPSRVRWNPRSDVRVRTLVAGRRLVRRGNWLCTGRVDSVVDLLRFGERTEGIVALDRLVREKHVRLTDVREAVANLPPCWGSGRARQIATLADGRAESPQETRLRLVIAGAGMPPPVAQHEVHDRDGFIGRVDFAYPDLKVAIEYDGMWHAERGAFLSDRRRLNRLTAAGWLVLHVTDEDLQRPERLLARIRAALAQRLRQTATR